MKTPSRTTKTLAHGLAGLAMLLTGTTAIAQGEPGAEMPFEDQAGELMSQVEFELQLSEVVLLNPYLEMDSPKVDEFDAAWVDITGAADALITYSVGVVEIVQQKKADQDVGELVSLLRELVDAMNALPTVQRNLSIDDVDGVLQEVAAQKTLTKALREAAPVTNGIADALRQVVVDTNDVFDLAVQETHDKIIAEERPLTEYINSLVVRRDATLNALLLLERARNGDADAWGELLESRPDVAEAVSIADYDNAVSLKQAEGVLIQELAKVSEIWGYIKPSYDEYQAILKELYAVENNIRQILRLAKLITENWDKAQRQLAKGKPNAFAAAASSLVQLALKRAARK